MSTDPTLGKLIAGRFRIESVIGSGGTGTVYRAIQEPLDRPVAVKMLRDEFSESPDLRRRFVREARAVAALSHPNIAMVHDFGVGRERSLFMALELVDGVPLDQVLDGPNTRFATIITLFDQILTGLAHAHARGIVHRDVKPANVLVARHEDGTPWVKIVDFGIAAVAGLNWEDETETGKGHVVGTPQYMAPEQARGERNVSETVDVYAVGLMLYRAVTGRDAFEEGTAMDILMAQVHQPPPPIVVRPGLEVPPELRTIIIDALAKSPRDRIPSARAFRSRLRSLLVDTTAATLPEGVLRPVDGMPSAEQTVPPTTAATAMEVALSPSGQPASAIRGEAPFVGREEDVARIVEIVRDAMVRTVGVIAIIEGEPGFGKSRAVTAARQHLADHSGFVVAQGGFHRDAERGLRGVREVFEGLLGTRPMDVRGIEQHLERRVGGPDGHLTAAALRVLAGFLRPSLNERPDRTVPDALFEILYRTLAVEAAKAPIAISLDDVQWAGAETESFLEFVASELQHRPAPIAIFLTAHSGQGANTDAQAVKRLARFEGHTVVRHILRPLDADAARRLLQSLLNATPQLTDTLVQRAGGNPMHLVQFARFLIEERLLERTAEGWAPREDVDVSAVLPPSLADMMALRIEQLEQIVPGRRLRDLLNRCAVLGRSFRFSVLERMLQHENRSDLLETIDADIDILLDEEFLRMRPQQEDDVLAFPSSLIRDALLEPMANRRTTRRLHAAAAEAKLSILSDDPDAIAGELAKHFQEAREQRKELIYAQRAADVAERNHRPHDAAKHLQRVIELLQHADASVADDVAALRLSYTLRLGTLLVGLGTYVEAQSHFQAVLEDDVHTTRQRILAVYGLARINRILGELDDARRKYDSALHDAESLGDSEVLTLGALGLARVEWHAGDLVRARELSERALSLAAAPEARRLRTEAIWMLGDVARSVGDTRIAVERFQQALSAFKRDENKPGIAKCYARLAVVHRLEGRYDEASNLYQKALDIQVQLGDRKGVAHQLNGLGDIARFRSEFARAADLYRRAGDVFQSLALPYDAAIALTNLGLVAMESRRFNDAEHAFRRAATVSERAGHAYLQIGIGLNLAHVLAQLGRDEESSETLDASLELADASALVDPDFARPLERLADAFALSGNAAEARQMFERARSMWDELGRDDDALRIDARLSALVENA